MANIQERLVISWKVERVSAINYGALSSADSVYDRESRQMRCTQKESRCNHLFERRKLHFRGPIIPPSCHKFRLKLHY